MTKAVPSLGASLRAMRLARKLTLAQLADLVGTSESHLSRIETGKRPDISRALIARLGQALDDPVTVSRAAGRLPAQREATIAEYAGAIGPSYERLTEPALRRLDAVPIAEAMLAVTPNAYRGDQVDTQVLCRRQRCEPLPPRRGVDVAGLVAFAPSPPDVAPRSVMISSGAAPESATRRRYLEAHAAAHLHAGSFSCSLPRLEALEELRLIDVACALLAPRALLDRAVRLALGGLRGGGDAPDLWGTSGAALVEDVATTLGIPSWIAVRRLAEEGLLEELALYESMPGSTS